VNRTPPVEAPPIGDHAAQHTNLVEPTNRWEWLTEAEVAKIIKHATNDHNRLMILLLIGTVSGSRSLSA
jgi:hypothetical protein